MKYITCSLMAIALQVNLWADVAEPPSPIQKPPEKISREVPAPKNKIIEKAATSLSHAVTSTAITDALDHGGSTAWLEHAIEKKASTIAANALDDLVLKDALAPVSNETTPNDVQANVVQAKDARTNDVHPTLRAWTAGMLVQSSPLDITLLGGAQTFRSVVSPVVALRIQNPESPWSLETGAALPRELPNDFKAEDKTVGTTHYSASVQSFYEIHVIADREFSNSAMRHSKLSLSAGFGVSMVHLSNRIDTTTMYTVQGMSGPYTYPLYQRYEDNKYSFCPLFRLGVVLFPDHLFSIRSDVAYVGYANSPSAAGETFNLGVSGLLFSAAAQVRL